jgi:UDP-N-acetylmuramate dehydrogenase
MVTVPTTAELFAKIEERVPLAPMTTLGIGGEARYFLRATNVDQISAGLAWAKARGLEVLILGGGSNVLIADEGFEGLVIRIDLRGITLFAETPYVGVKCAAGEPWDEFVDYAVMREWAGIECLSGIPGSVGATPIQNVGAYGQDVSETIVRVEALDRHSGTVRWFTKEECRFGYRRSFFKNDEPGRYIVLNVAFRLQPEGEASVRYPELRTYLEERGEALTDLRQVRSAVIAIRKRKGMVLDAADPDTRSDGSFFMNPLIDAAELDAFLQRAQALAGDDVRIPHFPADDGTVKLSAAWLIEHAGFHKGLVHGNVGLSSKHTLAVINRGGGTAREVLELVRMVQAGVRETFGVEIQPEPNFVGFE